MIGGKRMFRAWKFIFLSTLSILLLTGCTASMEEKADNGVAAAKEVFFAEAKERTDEIEGIKLYKPAGFTVNDKSDAQNIVLNRNKETFILFINPNEADSSELFYELLIADTSKEIIAEESFTTDGVFGFAAVVKSEQEQVELIASVGGVKMTTMGKKKKVTDDLTQMMEIVRSIKQSSE